MALNLPLGANTATITVQDSNGKIQFSTDGGTTWSDGPINWQPAKGSNAPLTATFLFGAGVSGMTVDNANLTPVGVIVDVAATGGTDKFTVIKTDGSGEDPKIVVTPS